MDEDRRLAAVDEVPVDSTYLLTLRDHERETDREAFLARVDADAVDEDRRCEGVEEPAGVVCRYNACQHLTHIPIDKGSGAPRRAGEVVCANHGATFDLVTGECTYGPCVGATLPAVDVACRNGTVYLDDDRFAFAAEGPATERDRSSSSNIKF